MDEQTPEALVTALGRQTWRLRQEMTDLRVETQAPRDELAEKEARPEAPTRRPIPYLIVAPDPQPFSPSAGETGRWEPMSAVAYRGIMEGG